MIGGTLGHYQITNQLGKGGMGEVYVADDISLDRKVALKFLPDAFTGDPERMARFEREAKLLASLNHPNIGAIYGLEQAEGKRFIVMELVEGETLAQRISKGALPADEALGICRQIAEGLEAAHEKGVIHRDLKPANVMITEGDKVKILDFGLAKALSEETQSVDSSHSPTLTEAMTRPGVILGTAAYMSPEQAKGKAVDKRTDIWAFGCILYECLTGKRAFEGETVTEILASVLTREPEWERLPVQVQRLLRRCLEKNPKKRLHDVGDMEILLENPSEPLRAKRPQFPWIWAGIATLLAIILAFPAFRSFHKQKPAEAMSFHITTPPISSDENVAVSPDGRWIAFVAKSSGAVSSLFLRDIKLLNPREIEGTKGASCPFWSPDSRSVGFFQRGRLKSVDVSSGSLTDISKAPYTKFGPGAWNDDGTIIFSNPNLLYRVSQEGGVPTAMTALDEPLKGTSQVLPCFLPDGRRFLYVKWLSSGSAEIYVGSLDPEAPKKLVGEATMPAYVEPGYLLFQRENAVYAQPFDVNSLELSGKPERIIENLIRNKWGSAAFSVSQNGLLVYRSAVDQAGSQFVWYDRHGKSLGTVGNPNSYSPGFRLSPDENRLAATLFDQVTNRFGTWLIECRRNVPPVRLCSDVPCILPAWSPDGLQIAFSSSRTGNYDIVMSNVSGAGKETTLVASTDSDWLKDWSRDGRFIAYATSDGLYAMPLAGERKSIQITKSSFALNTPAFSFDGKWVAFISEESGMAQIYILPFPSEGRPKVPVSTDGGFQPRWRGDGKELYYLASDGKMMAVEIMLENGIKLGRPIQLFDTGLDVHPDDYQYDVTADGRRFILLQPLAEEKQTLVPVITNWISLLKNK